MVLCLHVLKNFSTAGRALYCISLLVRKMDWIAVRSHRLVSIWMKNALFQSCIDECIVILLLRLDYNVRCRRMWCPNILGWWKRPKQIFLVQHVGRAFLPCHRPSVLKHHVGLLISYTFFLQHVVLFLSFFHFSRICVSWHYELVLCLLKFWYLHIQYSCNAFCSLSHTLMLVPNLHWIIIEDAEDPTPLVANLLKNSGIRYTHLTAATPKEWKLKEKVCLLCN